MITIHFVLDSDTITYRARTFAIAAKSNFKTNWTAQYNINLKKQFIKAYNLACYYSIPVDNFSTSLLPDQIDANLCTHLIVAFAQVQNNTVYFKSSYDIDVCYFFTIINNFF